jgi:prophage antirepressor-like protein
MTLNLHTISEGASSAATRPDFAAPEIQVFDFEDCAVRTVTGPDGNWWFVGADVCRALTIGNSRDALSRLDEDEKGVGITDTLGGRQQMTIISEPGLYRLIFTSRVDAAERFKRWLAHDVLPALRKTGRYEMPHLADGDDAPDIMIRPAVDDN